MHEIVKKGKETHASFTVEPQAADVRATVHEKWLVKVGKELTLWVADMNRTCFH